jgi:hypothetical protein
MLGVRRFGRKGRKVTPTYGRRWLGSTAPPAVKASTRIVPSAVSASPNPDRAAAFAALTRHLAVTRVAGI